MHRAHENAIYPRLTYITQFKLEQIHELSYKKNQKLIISLHDSYSIIFSKRYAHHSPVQYIPQKQQLKYPLKNSSYCCNPHDHIQWRIQNEVSVLPNRFGAVDCETNPHFGSSCAGFTQHCRPHQSARFSCGSHERIINIYANSPRWVQCVYVAKCIRRRSSQSLNLVAHIRHAHIHRMKATRLTNTQTHFKTGWQGTLLKHMLFCVQFMDYKCVQLIHFVAAYRVDDYDVDKDDNMMAG